MDNPLDASMLESTDFAHIFDAITGGTCADRFLSSLTNPADAPLSGPLDMPLVAAQAPAQLSAFANHPAPPSPPHPAFAVQHALHDLAPEYSLPMSAITNASERSPSPRCLEGGGGRKRGRSAVEAPMPRGKKQRFGLASRQVSHPNASYASDITQGLPVDEFVVRNQPPRESPSPHHLFSCQQTRIASRLSQIPSSAPSVKSTLSNPVSNCNASLQISSQPKVQPQLQPQLHPQLHPQSHQLVSGPTPPKSHTRKCREKVTRQFEHLLHVLPPPPRGVEVKHKAQILDYTIKIFRYLLLQRTTLQAQIALASKPALTQCINNVIANATANLTPQARIHPLPILTLLEPFVGLYCVKKTWTYAELWLVHNTSNQASLLSCLFNSDDNAVLTRLDAFATESRARYQRPTRLTSGIVRRAMATQRSEWLTDPSNDPSIFLRANLARTHGISVVNAVPVLTPRHNYSAVVLFADLTPHHFVVADMDMLQDYSNTLSNIYIDYVNTFDNSIPSKLCIPTADVKPCVSRRSVAQRQPQQPSLSAARPRISTPPVTLAKREPLEINPMNASPCMLPMSESSSRWLSQ